MHLYVEAMDAVLEAVDESGRIRLRGEAWTVPSLQEKRAVIHAARMEIERLVEVIDRLNPPVDPAGGSA